METGSTSRLQQTSVQSRRGYIVDTRSVSNSSLLSDQVPISPVPIPPVHPPIPPVLRSRTRIRDFERRRYIYLFWFFLYITLGVVAYCTFEAESPASFSGAAPTSDQFIDGSYFAVTGISTVGYGDIFPHSALAQFFVCVYVLLGLPLFSIVSAIIGGVYGELEDRFLNYIVETYGGVEAGEGGVEAGEEAAGGFEQVVEGGGVGEGVAAGLEQYVEGVEVGDGAAAAAAAAAAAGLEQVGENQIRGEGALADWFLGLLWTMVECFASCCMAMWQCLKRTMVEFLRRVAVFIRAWPRELIKILSTLVLSVCLTAVGALVRNTYLAIMTISTVGFGDESFTTPATRLFAIFWILPAVLVFGRFLSLVGDYFGTPEPEPLLPL